MNERPELTRDLDQATFAEYYWLRDELAAFCRLNDLSTAGGKRELTARVTALLTGKSQPAVQRRPPSKAMPVAFTRQTPVGSGWRCSEALRAFICLDLGRPFRFDRFMREQISAGSGALLGEVIDEWRKQEGRKHEIEPQFEYNRFTKEYRLHAPKATHATVVRSWNSYRALPLAQRPSVEDMARDASRLWFPDS